jgi:hypothetical protein
MIPFNYDLFFFGDVVVSVSVQLKLGPTLGDVSVSVSFTVKALTLPIPGFVKFQDGYVLLAL